MSLIQVYQILNNFGQPQLLYYRCQAALAEYCSYWMVNNSATAKQKAWCASILQTPSAIPMTIQSMCPLIAADGNITGSLAASGSTGQGTDLLADSVITTVVGTYIQQMYSSQW